MFFQSLARRSFKVALTVLMALSSLVSNSVFAQTDDIIDFAKPGSSSESRTRLPGRGKRAPIGISYFLIGGQDFGTEIQDRTRSNPDIFDSFISINYRANREVTFSFRPTFGYSLEGVDRTGRQVTNKARVRDHSFVMTTRNNFEDILPAELSHQFQARLYLPTSDRSKEEGLITILRLQQVLNYDFSSEHAVRYTLVPDYYFQRTTAYQNRGSPFASATRMFDLEHRLEYIYTINNTFSLRPQFVVNDEWFNRSDANEVNNNNRNVNLHRSSVSLRAGVGINVSNELFTIISLQQRKVTKIFRDSDREDQYSYSVLMTGAVF